MLHDKTLPLTFINQYMSKMYETDDRKLGTFVFKQLSIQTYCSNLTNKYVTLGIPSI